MANNINLSIDIKANTAAANQVSAAMQSVNKATTAAAVAASKANVAAAQADIALQKYQKAAQNSKTSTSELELALSKATLAMTRANSADEAAAAAQAKVAEAMKKATTATKEEGAAMGVAGEKADLFKGIIEGMGQQIMYSLTYLPIQAGQALLQLGQQSIQMAGKFEQVTNMIQALTGSSTQEMAAYKDQLHAMALETGQDTTTLANGLYYVISAGYKGAQAMKVLELATKDAAIGMTDAQTTSNALTTVLKAFSIDVSQADAVNGEMLKTVTLGKMKMGDYASAISKVSAVATQYHVSVEAVNASLATLTENGVKNANVAGTDTIHLIQALMSNTDKLTTKMHDLGYKGFSQAKFNAMDFQDRIGYLNTFLGNHSELISQIIGKSINAAQAYVQLSQHASDFTANLGKLSNQMDNAKTTQDAWNITAQGFNVKMGQAQQAVNAVMEAIGTQLLPVLGQLLDKVGPIATGFQQWFDKTQPLKAPLKDLATNSDAIQSNIKKISDNLNPAIKNTQTWSGNVDSLNKNLSSTKDVINQIGTILAFVGPSAAEFFDIFFVIPTQFAMSVIHELWDMLVGFFHWMGTAYNAVAGAVGLPQINMSAIGGGSSGGGTSLTPPAAVNQAILAQRKAQQAAAAAAAASSQHYGPGGSPSTSSPIGGGGIGTGTGKGKAASNKLTADEIAQVVKDAAAQHFKISAALLSRMGASQQYAYIAKEAKDHNVKVETLLKGLPKDLAQWIEYTLSNKKSGKSKKINPQAFTSSDIADIEANINKLGISFDDTLFETMTNAQKMKYLFQQIGDNQQTLAEVMKGAHKSLIDYVEYQLSQTLSKLSKSKKGKNTLTVGGITGTSATAAAISQGSSSFTVINNITNNFGAININGASDTKSMYNKLLNELSRDLKRSGLYSSMTSGGVSSKK